jgi:hypothetical protein
MNAPLYHSEIRIDPLTVFKARAEARALLWKCCEIDLYEAVDILLYAAKRAGLIDQFGQDRVQQIIADAFHRFRPHEVPQ